MAQLDKTFPTGDCAMCILSPKLVECARNKNIEIITLADVQGISGEPGNFKVKLRQNPRYVDLDKCNACGDCTEACPVDLPNEFDRRLGTRKAIFRPYPQAIPNVFGISKAEGRAPCKASCPAGVNAQGYVALVAAGKFKEAYELVRERCPLPSACGRVCQHPCEDDCNRGEVDQPVAIRDLKRFVADYVDAEPGQVPAGQARGRQAGRQRGHHRRRPGRPDRGLRPGHAGLRRHRVRGSAASGRHAALRHPQLPPAQGRAGPGDPAHPRPGRGGEDGHAGRRSGEPPRVRVQGRVRGARRVAQPQAGHPRRRRSRRAGRASTSSAASTAARRPTLGSNVLVIGGGDVAMDAARCARRLPGVTSVHLACLESRAEMPAHSWEAAEALEEGIVFHNSLGPTERRDRRGQGGRRGLPGLHQRVRRAGAVRPAVRRFQDQRPWRPTRSS